MFKKNQILVFVLTLVLLVGISCAPQSGKPEKGIQFKEEEYDFGIKDEWQKVEHDFVYTNIGTKTITIQDVKPECSCTVADTWNKTVAPGESGKIHITLDTTALQGDVTRVIKVKTDIPKRENILLTVKVNVQSRIAIKPRNVFLGEVLPMDDKPLSGSFEIENNLGVPLRILEINAPDGRTRFTLTTLEQNMRYKVDFSVNPPYAGEEMIKGEFRIKTDNKDYPEIVPTFSYFIPPKLAVFPNPVNIDLDQFKNYVIPFLTNINIKSTMDKPIRIQELKLTGGKGIKYEILEATRDLVYQILIEIPLDYKYNKDEDVYFTFRILNDPKNTLYNVPLKFYKKGTTEGN